MLINRWLLRSRSASLISVHGSTPLTGLHCKATAVSNLFKTLEFVRARVADPSRIREVHKITCTAWALLTQLSTRGHGELSDRDISEAEEPGTGFRSRTLPRSLHSLETYPDGRDHLVPYRFTLSCAVSEAGCPLRPAGCASLARCCLGLYHLK